MSELRSYTLAIVKTRYVYDPHTTVTLHIRPFILPDCGLNMTPRHASIVNMILPFHPATLPKNIKLYIFWIPLCEHSFRTSDTEDQHLLSPYHGQYHGSPLWWQDIHKQILFKLGSLLNNIDKVVNVQHWYALNTGPALWERPIIIQDSGILLQFNRVEQIHGTWQEEA